MSTETSPSKPLVGAGRDLARSIGGTLLGFLMVSASKVGLDIPMDPHTEATISLFIGIAILSPVAAFVGKHDRQANDDTTALGKIL